MMDYEGEPDVVTDTREPVSKRVGTWFKDHLNYWYLFLGILLLIGTYFVIEFLDLPVYVILVFFLGSIVWWYWGNRMAMKNPKYILVINLETMQVRPVRMGRRYWTKVNKVGVPWLAMRTPSGLDIEIAKWFDPETMTVVYPEECEYTDAVIAAMPSRYGEMVADLVQLRQTAQLMEFEIDAEAQKRASILVAQFENMFKEALYDKRPETEEGED